MEHGIRAAFYNASERPVLRATLECLCGYRAAGMTWGEAGEDLHLEDEGEE